MLPAHVQRKRIDGAEVREVYKSGRVEGFLEFYMKVGDQGRTEIMDKQPLWKTSGQVTGDWTGQRRPSRRNTEMSPK